MPEIRAIGEKKRRGQKCRERSGETETWQTNKGPKRGMGTTKQRDRRDMDGGERKATTTAKKKKRERRKVHLKTQRGRQGEEWPRVGGRWGGEKGEIEIVE